MNSKKKQIFILVLYLKLPVLETFPIQETTQPLEVYNSKIKLNKSRKSKQNKNSFFLNLFFWLADCYYLALLVGIDGISFMVEKSGRIIWLIFTWHMLLYMC